MGSILHWALIGLILFAFVLLMMTPFFIYLYRLNNKQTRYFKKLGAELGLEFSSLGNKIKRDFPELNGNLNGLRCFVGARRSKGRHGSSAQTRNHLPIILIEFAVSNQLNSLILEVSPEQIKHQSDPNLGFSKESLTGVQRAAQNHGSFYVQLSQKGVIQIVISNELSSNKQYDKVLAITTSATKLVRDIQLNFS
jgi:hypothetical protein